VSKWVFETRTDAWHRLAGRKQLGRPRGRGRCNSGARKTAMLRRFSAAEPGTAERPQAHSREPAQVAETPVARAPSRGERPHRQHGLAIRVRRGYATRSPQAAAPCRSARAWRSPTSATAFALDRAGARGPAVGRLRRHRNGSDRRRRAALPSVGVDGATIEIDVTWNGDPATPRYAQSRSAFASRPRADMIRCWTTS